MSRVAGVVAAYAAVFFVALPALLWADGGRLDALLGFGRLGPAWRGAGALIGGAGALLTAWSMAWLGRRGRGWPISHLPPRRLVGSGPYALVRHPIYVGYAAAFAGAGLADGSAGRGLAAAGFLTAGWLVYALGFEEPRLVRRYGEAFRVRRRQVPLFPVPRGLRARAAAWAKEAWRLVRPAVERMANRTVLFRVGPTVWVGYGAALGLGAGIMAVALGGELEAVGAGTGAAALYLVGLAASMLVGGRLAWLLYQLPDLLRRRVRAIELLHRVGFVSWGGYAGLFAFGLGFAHAAGVAPLWLLDRTLLWGFLVSGIGRLGCLGYGCCYGRPWADGIVWRNPASKVCREHPGEAPVPRVPTQLLSSLHAFAIVGALVAVSATRAPAGTATAVGLLLYAPGRFAVDCLRDEARFGAWGLTAGQVGSLVVGAAGFALILAVGGPPGWSAPALPLSLPHAAAVWGAAAASALLVFLVCGLHWREVGRW